MTYKEITRVIIGEKGEIKDNKSKVHEVVKDCFDISTLATSSEKGLFLLLDEDGIVLAVNNMNYKQLVGYHIKPKYLTYSKSPEPLKRTIKSKHQSYEICFFQTKTVLNKKLKTYVFLFIVRKNGEKAFDTKIVDIFNDCVSRFLKSIDVINKYLNNATFFLQCLDFVDEGICICDEYGRLIYHNKPTLKIMGKRVVNVLNKKMEDFCDIKPLLYQVMESKRKIIDAEYNFNFNGKTVHMISSGYPIFDNSGEVVGAIDIFRGIERSRKLANVIAGYNASYEFEDIIGESNKIKETIKLAKSFSCNKENILIKGESGTGKELFAQSIHNYGYRKKNPFIAINCANLPNELIESELFGYEEGAFTGARGGGKPGKFELAGGGTLFLDEIGEMQYHLQAKLLRAIETKSIVRLGGSKPIKIDARIIAATNRDLKAMMDKGQFRQDLYYRLTVLTLNIPPLNQRGDDILKLAEYFIEKIGLKYGKKITGIESNAKNMLLANHWPGNVRELENLMSRAVFICDTNYISKNHLIKAGLDEVAIVKNKQIPNKKELKEINREIILETLKLTNGNKKRAAELLGISRQTIYRTLR